jgi:hypothetical protein
MTADYSNADGSVAGDITLASVEQLDLLHKSGESLLTRV